MIFEPGLSNFPQRALLLQYKAQRGQTTRRGGNTYILGTVHCEQKSLATESLVQCKPRNRQCTVRLHFALHCSATLTLASVVTCLLEEYIQWKDPPGRFITSPEFISGKGGGVCDLCIGAFPFLSLSGRFPQPHEKGTKCFFLHRGGHFTV